jgi:hypothetical protein
MEKREPGGEVAYRWHAFGFERRESPRKEAALMGKNSKSAATAVAVKPRPVSVAFPQDNETITSDEYTIQIAAIEPAAGVEVSIDQGDWQSCREALGLWWFDWAGIEAGEHEVTARLRRPDGAPVVSEPRIFFAKKD